MQRLPIYPSPRTRRTAGFSVTRHVTAVIASCSLLCAASASAQPSVEVDVEGGPPQRWHASLPVSNYSVVDARHGHVFTTLPAVSWSGRGPTIDFRLYHSSANVTGTIVITPLSGIDLGPGWTVSYSDQLIDDAANTKFVLDDDGQARLFTRIGSTDTWSAPPGYDDVLAFDPALNKWKLTETDQSYRRYDEDGRLLTVGDASGNEVTIEYETYNPLDGGGNGGGGGPPGGIGPMGPQSRAGPTPETEVFKRISRVIDASGMRWIGFEYDAEHLLEKISAPGSRFWLFTYTNGDWVSRLTDPMFFNTEITYVSAANAKIRRVADSLGNAHLLSYDNSARVQWVKDPEPFDAQIQSISYGDDSLTTFSNVYTDRRGKTWTYGFQNPADVLVSLTDPLGNVEQRAWDANYNIQSYTNGLNKTWNFTNDASGNLLTATDPLGHRTTWTYGALNNLTSVTPALDAQGAGNPAKTVTFFYDDAETPTLATRIVEPADQSGGTASTTTLTYYGLTDDTLLYGIGAWAGKLDRVIDANNVETRYEYDIFGQFALEEAGLSPAGVEGAGDTSTTTVGMTAEGWAASGGNGFGSGGSCTYNANGQNTGCGCLRMHPELPEGGAVPRYAGFPASCDRLLGQIEAGCNSFSYDAAGRMLSADACVSVAETGETSNRQKTFSYDELDRLINLSTVSDEALGGSTANQPVERDFAYMPDWVTGTFDRVGPDGDLTQTLTDDAGRPSMIIRGVAIITIQYNAANQATVVSNSNGTETGYTYDEAMRLTTIEHRLSGGSPQTLLMLLYNYSPDGLIMQITETDDSGQVSTVTFGYDNRNRLTDEARVGTHPYSLTYTYDAVGNRLSKANNLSGEATTYVYDVSDPATFGSHDNRLMRTERRDSLGDLIETVWYGYRVGTGAVDQIVYDVVGDPTLRRTYFN